LSGDAKTSGGFYLQPGAPKPRLISIALVGLVAAVITCGISLVWPKSYRAEARILPNVSQSRSSSLLGLASGMGLSDVLSGLGAMENPVLTYPEILTSRQLLLRTVLSPYPPDSPDSTNTVLAAIHADGPTERRRVEDGIRRLRDASSIRANPRSGLISVSAVTGDSVLSAYLVNQMLLELDRFNVETRATQGRATREFIEGRMREARVELNQAERELTAFRQSNLRIGNSPQLLLEQARLEREVDARSELYRLTARQYELARIEEKRDTPTFSVIDPAVPPVRKYRPQVILNTLIAGISATTLAAIADHLLRSRRRSSDLTILAESA
jgi:uncharacterized protein involved in exopolysaccharide biosynthesis